VLTLNNKSQWHTSVQISFRKVLKKISVFAENVKGVRPKCGSFLHRPARTWTLAFMFNSLYASDMAETLEARVQKLEEKVGELDLLARKKNPWPTFGLFRDDQDFEEAMRLGRDYRQQQTCKNEIAGC
jgi:hypothetical protein